MSGKLRPPHDWKINILLWVAFLVLVYGAARTRNAILQLEQQRIDQDAEKAVEQGGNYFLFLRSFLFDDQMRVIDDNSETLKYVCWVRWFRLVLQSYVAVALRACAPTLGIGGHTKFSYGLTSYDTSDERWKDDFQRLADCAAGIFVLPSVTRGSDWELQWLIHNALEKTVFVVPGIDVASKRAFELFWDHYVDFLLRYGGDELLVSEAFESASGGLFIAKHKQQRSLTGEGATEPSAQIIRARLRLEQLRSEQDVVPECFLAIEQSWPFSSKGFRAAGAYLLQQRGSRSWGEP